MSESYEIDEASRYSFRWGPMTVTRMAYVPGRGYSLEVRTAHQSMQVYVSEKGRKIEPMPVRAAHEGACELAGER